jgi:hypothetical protein
MQQITRHNTPISQHKLNSWSGVHESYRVDTVFFLEEPSPAEFAEEVEYVEEGQVVSPDGHVPLPVILVTAYVLVQVTTCTCVCTVATQPLRLVVDVEPSPPVATPEEPNVAT